MPNPTLSLILCSRNDEYMGNSRWRLETALNYVGERVDALGRAGDVEVLVADWGSDVPLREVVALQPAAAAIVSFVTVPPALAKALQRDSPFPEVLALNAAARRARGCFIGRIDQDTLVGDRFLRWMFEHVQSPQAGATLFFANRRSVPYRFTVGSPSLGNVTSFVRRFGARLPVWRENAATSHLFWTSYVGIWLADRTLWHEYGGYDERLIYYDWMETDMIRRLARKYPVVDLGELTGHDFYHLEHYHPRMAWVGRPHAIRNADVDLASPPPALHPNPESWGLRDHRLVPEPASSAPVVRASKGFARRPVEFASFALSMLRLAAATASDRIVIFSTERHQVWSRRLRVVRQELAGRPANAIPRALWSLWRKWYAAPTRRMRRVRAGRLRAAASRTLSALGLLAVARKIRLRILLATSGEIRRRERAVRERFSMFRQEYGAAVGHNLNHVAAAPRAALVISSRCPTVEGELCTIKALQLAGFRAVLLLEDEQRAFGPYYELAGVDEVHFWSEFLTSRDYSRDAAAAVGQCESLEDLMTFTHAGVRVGRIAVCTALRRFRFGALDLRAPGARQLLARCVAASLSSVAEAQNILNVVHPDLVLTDPEYTPKGELFETCLDRELDVIACDTAHRSNAVMFKRYGRQNRDEHLTTLSACSWALVRNLEWTSARRARLADELATSYVAGDWFGTPWAGPVEPAALRASLGLDPAKKTAFIFPHMLWDAPVMWGRPLFSTYQEWFVETVRAACRNARVNWVIKIHPAHAWKQDGEAHREEYLNDAAELRVLRDHLGALPPHVIVLPPDTPLSTFSLFAVMDYCLTVRGTVGVEAARLGIPVLTAGPARYAELGFTVDSASREEYLARLARIEETPALSPAQRELAERFAYGLFLLRPLRLESVTWDAPASSVHNGARQARLNVRTEDEWRRAADVGALSQWFVSREEDFLSDGA